MAVIAAFGVPAGAYAAGATSTFASDAEGWLLSGDTTTAFPDWVYSGGNPDGYIRGTDLTIGGVWYWQAPAAFLGNQSASYGQNLSFDLRMRGSGPLFDSSDVILAGAGLTLHFDFPTVPVDTTWTQYTVALSDAAAWKEGSLAGPAVTQLQFASVLGNLTSLRIRGEFITGSDTGDLDNVVLAAVPEPETWAMLIAGLGLLGPIARRRTASR